MSEGLWNEDVDAQCYGNDRAAYQGAILEQYKLYVEMADRVSQRRGLANTFFLTLNTAIFTLFGALFPHELKHANWLIFPLIGILTQCLAWYYIVRSYRLLNGAKFRVVGLLEQRLPSSPYWRAEWKQLGEGKDRKLYWPLSHVESYIPLLFAGTYLATYIFLIFN